MSLLSWEFQAKSTRIYNLCEAVSLPILQCSKEDLWHAQAKLQAEWRQVKRPETLVMP